MQTFNLIYNKLKQMPIMMHEHHFIWK